MTDLEFQVDVLVCRLHGFERLESVSIYFEPERKPVKLDSRPPIDDPAVLAPVQGGHNMGECDPHEVLPVYSLRRPEDLVLLCKMKGA